MADKPNPGDVQDGYRFIGGDPANQTSWVSVSAPRPPVKMQKSILGAAPSILGATAPAAAAIAAGAAQPELAPVTAPAAYFATKGLLEPKEVAEHPYRTTAESALMGLPGTAEADVPGLIVRHPGAMQAAAATAGAAGGSLLGKVAGMEGETGGALGGGYVGWRLGQQAVKSAENRMIEDAILGKRAIGQLPSSLLPRYMSQARARAAAYAKQAIESGEAPNLTKIPTGLREAVQKMYEERVKNVAQLPNLVQLPEQIRAAERTNQAAQSILGELKPEAQARGMAYAAGRSRPLWVPAKRGASSTVTKLFKLQ